MSDRVPDWHEIELTARRHAERYMGRAEAAAEQGSPTSAREWLSAAGAAIAIATSARQIRERNVPREEG